jgi:hypothetical protein
MNNDNSYFLKKLKERRFDELRQETVLYDEAQKSKLPLSVQYTLEAMREIDPTYSYSLFSAVRKTQNLITQNLKQAKITVDVRYQGPHGTDTHIELFGDLDLLVILRHKGDKPTKKVENVAKFIVETLSNTRSYNKVDYSSRNKIYIQTQTPKCNVSITPAVWVDSNLYKKSKLEINRAIAEFDFQNKTKKIYLPFLNIARINTRDRNMKGSVKPLIRLVRNLERDTELENKLTFNEICGVVYNIPGKAITLKNNDYLQTLKGLSDQLKKLIHDDEYRIALRSPSRVELVFGKKDRRESLHQLKTQLDLLIEDLQAYLASKNKSLADAFHL